MSFSRVAWSATLVLVLSTAVFAGAVQAQTSAPQSLTYPLGDLYPAGNSQLANGTAPQTGACAPAYQASSNSPQTAVYTLPSLPFNGSNAMYHIPQSISWSVQLTANSVSPTGFTVRVELRGAQAPLVSQATATGTTGTQAQTATGTFNINETSMFEVHDGKPIAFAITISPAPTAQGPAPPTAQGQVQCGSSTKLTGVTLVRGMPGNGDLDGDGIPDCGSAPPPCAPEDTDVDGDGSANSAEAASVFAKAAGAKGPFDCTTLNPPPAQNPAVRPGSDSDGDGTNDEIECQQGYNPTSAQSVPPRPRTLMDILLPIILILVILGIIAALVILFLKFGKTVNVSVVSTAELFIPAGTKGKYELNVENLSKKGDPRTYQLVVGGMPEGWDAKLNVDHVTLDSKGGPNNQARVWLEVEAPTHTDPESAVVTLKAVPLNKAGRKDTFKLPGRASTITSINVPAGSKVPVKRGGKIAAAKPKDEPAEAPALGAGNNDNDPVITIEGIGETFAPKLEKAGIKTIGDLRRADPALVAKKTGAPPATVASWQQMAELTQLDGIGPQFAEQLVRSGVTSIAQLAEQKPKELVAQIEKTNAARTTPIQGAGIQDKQAKNFVKTAQKWMKDNPAGAAAAPVAAAAAPAAAPAAPAAPAPAPAGAKPQLQVGGLRHEPPAFRQGEAVKSIVNVTNNGKDKSTIKLSLFVNDGLADVQTVTVKPGKAQDVQFKWTAQEKNKLNIRGELVSQ